MKCIHGNKIRVILEPMNKYSHIIYKANDERNFIKIIGCEYCKWIEVIIENYIPNIYIPDIAERYVKNNEIHVSEIKMSEIPTA